MGKQWLTVFFSAPKSLQMVIAAMKLKDAYSLEGKLWPPRQHNKKQRHYFPTKGPSSQGMDVRVRLRSWALKNWCFWTVVLKKTLTCPLDCKEIQPVHPKGDQSWVFTGKTDVEAETPMLWPPHGKSWLIGKDPDAGRDWGQEEKGMTEDEMAGWHHWLDGHEFEWTLGDGDGQGGLACCNSWVAKSRTLLSDWTELMRCGGHTYAHVISISCSVYVYIGDPLS